MNLSIDKIIEYFLDFGPEAAFTVAILVLSIFYFFNLKDGKVRKKVYGLTLAGAVLVQVIYGSLVSWGQYDLWSNHQFSQFLLPPYQSIEYFLFYSWSHFWFRIVIGLGLASIFYLFLRGLKKYKERFFRTGELELGFATAVIAGWPGFLVFVPIAFVMLILISLFNKFVLKKSYTTIGSALILTSALTLIIEPHLIELMNLEVFSP